VYGSINTWVPRTTLEPFALVKAMPRVLSQQNIYGTEAEVTPGLLVQGFPGWKVDYDVTGTLQRGSYSNDSIHAGSRPLPKASDNIGTGFAASTNYVYHRIFSRSGGGWPFLPGAGHDP
jgi:hypothetical protein